MFLGSFIAGTFANQLDQASAAGHLLTPGGAVTAGRVTAGRLLLAPPPPRPPPGTLLPFTSCPESTVTTFHSVGFSFNFSVSFHAVN